MKQASRQKLGVLGLLAAFLLHFPFVSLFNRAVLISGIPLLFWYLAVIFTGLLVGNYWLVSSSKQQND